MIADKPDYFKNSLYTEDFDKLALPEFWIEEAPAHWSASNYLFRLIQTKPGIDKANGNRNLAEDMKLVEKHTIPGTTADTAISMMVKNKKTNKGKDAIECMWDKSKAISAAQIKYSVEQIELRSTMAAEINQTEKQRINKKRRIEDNQSDSADNNSGVEVENPQEDQKEQDDNIWLEWKRFLNNPLRRNLYEPLSPEGNNVIWSGPSVRRRCNFPKDLYERLLFEFEEAPLINIKTELQGHLDKVLDADTMEQYDDGIEKLKDVRASKSNKDVRLEMDFFINMMERAKETYENGEQFLAHSEACVTYELVLPCLKAVVQLLKKRGHVMKLYPGEEELQAMTTQQQQQGVNDARFIYKADGIIRSELDDEILILETSSAYNLASHDKVGFDHYKAMFGMLAVMKTISEKYEYAHIDLLKSLKLHLIHVHGTAIRWWTMSMPEKDVFVMYKERREEIPNSFSKKDVDLLPYIRLYFDLSAALKDTIDCLNKINSSHRNTLQTKRYSSSNSLPSLRSVVNPLVIRFTENKHSQLVSGDGPESVPNSQ